MIFLVREWTEASPLGKKTHHKALYLFGFICLLHYKLESR
jgi:hypothetical protein